MSDRVKFFSVVRESGLFKDNKLNNAQIDTMNAVLDECEKQGVDMPEQVAYIFATAAWEANNPKKPELRLTPIKEFGGEAYLKSKKYYPYYGRGLSQLTWLDNYKKESKRLGIDLVTYPDLILHIETAANSHVYCMKNGSYTGKKLSDHINDKKIDFINSRRIINGTDKASEISAIAFKFLSALK